MSERYGEAYFRAEEKKIVEGLSKETSAVVVATGGGLPGVPGVIGELNRIGFTVYLRANIEALWKRLSMDPKELDDRLLLKQGGKIALAKRMQEREQYYNQAAMTLNTDLLSVDEVCDILNYAMNRSETNNRFTDAGRLHLARLIDNRRISSTILLRQLFKFFQGTSPAADPP